MATNKPQEDFQKQGVRIPRELHDRIHEAARESGRSYNSELIARLQQSFIAAVDVRLIDWMRVTGVMNRFARHIGGGQDQTETRRQTERLAKALVAADRDEIAAALGESLGVTPPDESILDFAGTLAAVAQAHAAAMRPRIESVDVTIRGKPYRLERDPESEGMLAIPLDEAGKSTGRGVKKVERTMEMEIPAFMRRVGKSDAAEASPTPPPKKRSR
jgi:hypothetical protein